MKLSSKKDEESTKNTHRKDKMGSRRKLHNEEDSDAVDNLAILL